MQVFVTVGTTKFEELIEVVDSLEFHQLLKDIGYSRLLIQVGAHKGKLSYSVNENAKTPEEKEKDIKNILRIKGFSSFYYDYKPSLKEDMEASSLVITHGGSGSILETLNKNLPCVAVVNETLMHNHQAELAGKLQTLGYTLSCKPKTLYETVKNHLVEYLGKRRKVEKTLNERSIQQFTQTMIDKYSNKARGDQKKSTPTKTMVVLGSGGHTSEMFQITSKLPPTIFTPVTYVMSNTDPISEQKVNLHYQNEQNQNSHSIQKIPRSRNVGQTYFSSIFTTLFSLLFSFKLILNEKPDVILCNGPGTCVPLCFIAFFLNLIRWKRCKIVYFESIARVDGLSLSGKILQFIATWFIVQWDDLIPKAKNSNVQCINLFFENDSSDNANQSTSKETSSNSKSQLKHRTTSTK